MSENQIVQMRDDMTDDQAMGQAEAVDARARDEAEMVEQIEGMDTTDLTMVSGKALEARVHNWGDLSQVNLAANPRTLAYVAVADGFEMTMTAGLELVFKDMAKVEVDVLVTARRDDDIFGFRGVEIIPA